MRAHMMAMRYLVFTYVHVWCMYTRGSRYAGLPATRNYRRMQACLSACLQPRARNAQSCQQPSPQNSRMRIRNSGHAAPWIGQTMTRVRLTGPCCIFSRLSAASIEHSRRKKQSQVPLTWPPLSPQTPLPPISTCTHASTCPDSFASVAAAAVPGGHVRHGVRPAGDVHRSRPVREEVQGLPRPRHRGQDAPARPRIRAASSGTEPPPLLLLLHLPALAMGRRSGGSCFVFVVCLVGV